MKTPRGLSAFVALSVVAVLTWLAPSGPAQAQEIGFKVTGMGVGAHQPGAEQSPVAVRGGSGFALGGFLITPISEHLDLQVEASYSRREFDLTNNPAVPSLAAETLLAVPIDSRFRADYVEIPVLLRVPVRTDSASIHALVGPAFGINVAAKLDDRVFPQSSSDDLTGSVRDLDLALVFGGGVTLASRFVVEGRYNLGLTSLLASEAAALGNLPDVEWRSFGVSAGVIF